MAMNPAGQDPATRPSGLVEASHTTALLPPKSQSFLDHLIAGFWPTGSSNNPDAAEQSANTAPSPFISPYHCMTRRFCEALCQGCGGRPPPRGGEGARSL